MATEPTPLSIYTIELENPIMLACVVAASPEAAVRILFPDPDTKPEQWKVRKIGMAVEWVGPHVVSRDDWVWHNEYT